MLKGVWYIDRVKIYIDGEVSFETNSAMPNPMAYGGDGMAPNQTDEYDIGRYNGGVEPTRFLYGKLQNVSVWNRALDDTEVADDLNTPGSVTSGRVAWLSMTEGTGTVVNNADSARNGSLGFGDQAPTWVEDCPAE